MILAAYRLAMDALTATFMSTVRLLVASMASNPNRAEAIDAMAPVLADLVRRHRTLAYLEAIKLLSESARAQGVADPYIPSESGYPEASVRTVLRENLRGTAEEASRAVAERLTQHVESGARETITRSVEDGRKPADAADAEHWSANAIEPDDFDDERAGTRALAWARVLTGAENCGFCVMLASRGPVYSGPDAAGRMLASDKWPDAKGYINSYHDNCDCVVVPIYDFSRWEGRDQWKSLERFYKERIQDKQIRYGDGRAKNEVIAALNRELYRMAKEGESLPIQDLRSL